MSFACPVCYASESQDRAIESAAMTAGGRFVRAPLPSVEGDRGDKDRVYYASRELSPRLTEQVKASLYKAYQEMRISLPDLMSTYTWLEQDLGVDAATLTNLFQRAQQPTAAGAYNRAVYLAQQAGVDAIPAYIVLVDSEVYASLDPSMFGGGLSAMREAVIAKIQQAQSPKGQKASHVR